LITDPSHAIQVWVNRNGLRAIAVGSGSQDLLNLLHLPLTADINPGDLLVTSGLGGRFPAGYPVAVVEAVQRNPGRPFAQVTARPSAHLDQIREVLLVLNPPPDHSAPCDPDDGPCPPGEPTVEPATGAGSD
jgi:rod shape-determining protein MreC